MGTLWNKEMQPYPTTQNFNTYPIRKHTKCRNVPYPRSNILRFPVPDDLISWDVYYPTYNPANHTADSVKGKPWADPEYDQEPCTEDIWNKVDNKSRIDRRSHTGRYKVVNGLPINPMGRTGITGRGCLGRWGPNHAADPIVTRWKPSTNHRAAIDPSSRKKILQFIAIQRRDTGEWAIPGGMVDPGETVTTTLRREFGEEALNTLETSVGSKEEIERRIEELFLRGSEIYRGYVDDPRNTDNAWMETVAYNFHDESGTSVGLFNLHAGDDAVGVQWMDIAGSVKLYASHVDMIRKVAAGRNAHW